MRALITFLSASLLFTLVGAKESVIDRIAILVDGAPITEYQIKDMQDSKKLGKKEAIEALIAQRLRSKELARLNIVVSSNDVISRIAQIAAENNVTPDQLLAQVKAKEGLDRNAYASAIKETLETRGLLQSLVSTKGSLIDQNELKHYYDNHKDEFNLPSEISLVRYRSRSRSKLEENIKNPDETIAGVEQIGDRVKLSETPPNFVQILRGVKEGSFTTILNPGDGSFVAFLVKKKFNEKLVPFDEAQEYIAQKLTDSRAQDLLQDYFKKIRQAANIKYLR